MGCILRLFYIKYPLINSYIQEEAILSGSLDIPIYQNKLVNLIFRGSLKMEKLILSVLALALFIGFSGCAKRVVEPDIVEIEQIKTENDMSSYRIYNDKNYQLLGVFEDTIGNNSKLNDIIIIIKEKINTKQKSFKNNPQPYTHNEELEMCKKRVFIGQYGRYKNSIERDDLLMYCMDKIFEERKNYYTGIASNAEIDNDSLLINSRIGNGDSYYITWQTVKTLKIDKKVYLIVTLSKNTSTEEILFLDTNLLKTINNKNMTVVQSPIKVDLNKFSKFI